jgi:eukaryotic-like serine/threonine-protein kinase
VIARQIADALAMAHDKGIVHRDLKPGNVKVTANDAVKVLDFGLAKAASDEVPDDFSRSPTVLPATQDGVIMGTAPYMSPEQARGEMVDKRSDIWAFGCVVFEMLTGRACVLSGSVGGRRRDCVSAANAARAPGSCRRGFEPAVAALSRQRRQADT